MSRPRLAATALTAAILAAGLPALAQEATGAQPPATGEPLATSLPDTPVARCERVLTIIKHLERHLRSPLDGRALAADLQDLRRMASPLAVPVAVDAGPIDQAPGAQLADNMAILVDLWNARLNDRMPFATIVPPRAQRLDLAYRSAQVISARLSLPEREHLVPRLETEIDTMRRYGQGAGPIPEAAIDNAIRIALSSVTGRPGAGPLAPYPAGPVPERAPAGSPPAPPRPEAPPSPPPPPSPPGSQPPSPYSAQLGAYAGSSALACQADRERAGQNGDTAMMLRAAECWSRPPLVPLWGDRALEALQWATDFAAIARSCPTLRTVIQRTREIGPRARLASSDPQLFTHLVQEAEWQRVWLKCPK